MTEDTRRGLASGLATYLIWGAVPIYFRVVGAVPPLEIMLHRVVWSAVLVTPLLLVPGLRSECVALVSDRTTLKRLFLSSLLIAINWFTATYAVSTQRTLQASLGYFLAPLVSVALGVLVLRERLGVLAWAAVGLAAAGVLVPALLLRELPWIAIVLAVSFSFYGFLRKTMRAGSVAGTFFEVAVLAPAALVVLAWTGPSHATRESGMLALLMLAGPITLVPQFLFAAAARRLPLNVLGLLQYVAPTGQFLVAVVLFGEPLRTSAILSFGLIWSGIALLAWDRWRER